LGNKAVDRLLARVLDAAREDGLLKARGRQRTDSTHVLAAIRTLNRLELVGETLRAALNAIAVAAPDWLRALLLQPGFTRRALCSSVPMGAPGALLMLPAPC
jgi:hypothetical protein